MFSQLVLFYIIGPADGIVWLRKIMISGYRADTALHWDCDCVWRGSVPHLSTSSSSSDSSFLLAISAWKFVVDDILNKKYCICEKKKHGRNSWMSDKLCGCRVSHQLNYILPFLTFCWLDVITFLMGSFFFYWIVFQRRGWNRRERKGRERERRVTCSKLRSTRRPECYEKETNQPYCQWACDCEFIACTKIKFTTKDLSNRFCHCVKRCCFRDAFSQQNQLQKIGDKSVPRCCWCV